MMANFQKLAKKEIKKDLPSKASTSEKKSKDDEDGKKKKRKKNKDPNAPKRAISRFMLFSKLEREVCLDYWNSLVSKLFEPHRCLDNLIAAATLMGLQVPTMLPGMVDGHGSQLLQRRQLYAGPMSKLRMLMICRMAKPEEVLIVENENGNIIRETLKDNDVLIHYKVIR
ncbi:hypothetical protein VNO80_30612 [Phaseolus coccineus]|uniref:Uncharacterized protein n=1 Tax=Phaseolus coccineus TaxID=3886 RepID=A0AAN9LI50_PHACN